MNADALTGEPVVTLADLAVGDDVMLRWGIGDRWQRFAIAGAPYPSPTGATVVQLVKASTGEVVVRRADCTGRVPALPRQSHERFGAPPAVEGPDESDAPAPEVAGRRLARLIEAVESELAGPLSGDGTIGRAAVAARLRAAVESCR